MPRVSIIMGVYNIKDIKQLTITIDSIIKQTYTDWELIICDDGSTNNTFELLNIVKNKDNRIKVIGYKENNGLAFALTECLKIAQGSLIARQDAEDISHPDRLQREIDFLDKYSEYAFVGCNANLYDNVNNEWGQYHTKEKPEIKDFLWTTQFLHPTVLFRRECLDKVNGYRISKETRRCQDYDLFMRMYGEGMRGYNIQDTLFSYYQVDGHQRELSWQKRFEEVILRAINFKNLGLMPWALPYVIKPLIIKLIPQLLYRKMKKGEGGVPNESQKFFS